MSINEELISAELLDSWTNIDEDVVETSLDLMLIDDELISAELLFSWTNIDEDVG